MRYFLVTVSSVLILFSCGNKKNSNTSETPAESQAVLTLVKTPAFDADKAFAYVKAQTELGPRVPNSAAHKKAQAYFVAEFKKLGWEVTEQKFEATAFDGKKLQLNNIVASYNPSTQKRILLASHWDTRPFADQEEKAELKNKPIDGANDGASGVGILLEIARSISEAKDKPKVGIDLMLFDGEDYGQPHFLNLPEKEDTWCLGSQYWAKNKHKAGYTAYYGILLDMVGAKNAKFAMEGGSMYYAPEVNKKVWALAAQLGHGQYFTPQLSSQIIDDHYYVNRDAHIPMIDIIHHAPETGNYFGAYWHTHDDNIEAVDPATLKAVGEVLLQAVYQE